MTKAQMSTTVDPTQNVKDLAEALSKRQDDLRLAERELTDEKISRLENQVRDYAAHSKEMRETESRRLDAIRQVDVQNQNTAAERALTAIKTLEHTTAQEREALRALVATTAQTLEATRARDAANVGDRLSTLERASYEGTGRRTVDDPRMAQLLDEVKSLRESRAGSVGGFDAVERARQQTFRLIGAAVALAGIIVTLIVKFG